MTIAPAIIEGKVIQIGKYNFFRNQSNGRSIHTHTRTHKTPTLYGVARFGEGGKSENDPHKPRQAKVEPSG